MYFQFLIEDQSTEILVGHVMEKLKEKYPEKEILYDSKPFKGIGHLPMRLLLLCWTMTNVTIIFFRKISTR